MTEGKKRLLIVDDEPDICEVLKAKFQRYGFDVLVAHEGREGFQKVKDENPDCVLLDIRIPIGEDGLTFLRRIRSYRNQDSNEQNRIRNLPVIVLTAAGEGMRPLFQAEGISDFVEKPFDSEDLKAKILKAMRS